MSGFDFVVTSIVGKHESPEVICIDKFLGDDAIRLLSSKINGNMSKRRLVLRGNCIGPAGAEALAAVLREKSNFSFISLEWNQIGSEGTTFLSEALTFNTNLIHLDLRNNGISDEGAYCLAKALGSNDTLKTLDLRWNQIGDRGALAFRDTMLERSPAIFVQTKGNPLSEAVDTQMDVWLQGIEDAKDVVQVQVGEGIMTSPENELQLSNTVHNAFQNAVLQKETAVLRQQCSMMQASCADLQRQLDSSALKIIQMEQLVLRHEFRSTQLSEAHKESCTRLSIALDEHKVLAARWDLERTALATELKQIRTDKDREIKIVLNESDAYKKSINKHEEEMVRLRAQIDLILSQSVSDRHSALEELRVALNKISVLTTKEQKLDAEKIVMTAKLARAIECRTICEQQLEQSIKVAESNLRTAMLSHAQEIEVSRADHSSQMTANILKINSLSQEITDLLLKISLLTSELTKQKIESDAHCDKAVLEARESERDKMSATIADLKLRLQVYLSTRGELDARCAAYVKEIKDLQEDHIRKTMDLQNHLATVEAELVRCRVVIQSLRDKVSSEEADSKLRTTELQDARISMISLQERADSTHRQLQEILLERQKQSEKITSLELLLTHATELRLSDFQTIHQNISRVMTNEFDTLRLSLRLKEGK